MLSKTKGHSWWWCRTCACPALQAEDAPRLVILDWMMPGMEGLRICQQMRASPQPLPTYIILLTAREQKEDVVSGLDAGANDYITKPFNRGELQARVRVGERVVELQSSLAARVKELQEALAHIKKLQGILPICIHCHRIRDDRNYWQRLEGYISEHSDAVFSHGLCPDCLQELYPAFLDNDEKTTGEPAGATGIPAHESWPGRTMA